MKGIQKIVQPTLLGKLAYLLYMNVYCSTKVYATGSDFVGIWRVMGSKVTYNNYTRSGSGPGNEARNMAHTELLSSTVHFGLWKKSVDSAN